MTDWIVGSSILIVMILQYAKFWNENQQQVRYALWAVVMIRLLCPVTLWNNQQLVHNITEVSRQMFQKYEWN